MNYEEYADSKRLRDYFLSHGQPVPKDIVDKIVKYETEKLKYKDTPIYGAMLAHSKFPCSDAKKECVENSVDKLLSGGDVDELDPGLLLGKIQCGKTDAFENIIGLAFDRGVDIAVIFTKGTNALAAQTLSRLQKDFAYFKKTDSLNSGPAVEMFDIMNIRSGLTPSRIRGSKVIIVCKKQANNLEWLISLFEKNKFLREKRTIFIDDEADFASRNYKLSDAGKYEKKLDLAKISEQIDYLRQKLKAPYLQVTATPYSLYLQPKGEIDLKNGKALAFRPRFTELVPVHDKYIGGNQYFVESADEDSMYSHLFTEASQKCMDTLGKKDQRYLTNGTKSLNTFPLTRALMAFLLGVAIRSIQRRELPEPKKYQGSAVIHVKFRRAQHQWQEALVNRLLEDIRSFARDRFSGSALLGQLFDELYADYKQSFGKAVANGQIDGGTKFPDREAALKEINGIFEDEECLVKVINVDNDVKEALDWETGELRLDARANIFIGGSILDRGITINNLISFFYGRDASSSQQDTVLQHSRMYGARDLEDMAVTRFHTTRKIYDMLARMHEIDENLRESIAAGDSVNDLRIKFIGQDNRFRPCSSSKIAASDAQSIKGSQRVLPRGFQTRAPKAIAPLVKEIDELIAASPSAGLDDPDFKRMSPEVALKILDLIDKTLEWTDDYEEYKSDMRKLKACFLYCADQARKSGREEIYALCRTGRNMSRLSRHDGRPVDAPDSGNTDLEPSKKLANDVPVLMLLRQEGKKNKVKVSWAKDEVEIGWKDAPFFWPVLLTQAALERALYVLDERTFFPSTPPQISPLLDGLDPALVLVRNYKEDIEETFGAPGDAYPPGEEKTYWEFLREHNASEYIQKNEDGKIISANENSDLSLGVNSLNNGVFPFVPVPYEYLLLKNGSRHCLLKLTPPSSWEFRPLSSFDAEGDLIDPKTGKIIMRAKDILTDHMTLKKTEDRNKNVCVWEIGYKVEEVVDAIDVARHGEIN
ncbi:MAG: Z1 domain-containing protein [Desulfovibrio sp.]|nr:Z1 domain-containing protein [Desulfovibrio sp.]